MMTVSSVTDQGMIPGADTHEQQLNYQPISLYGLLAMRQSFCVGNSFGIPPFLSPSLARSSVSVKT